MNCVIVRPWVRRNWNIASGVFLIDQGRWDALEIQEIEVTKDAEAHHVHKGTVEGRRGILRKARKENPTGNVPESGWKACGYLPQPILGGEPCNPTNLGNSIAA